MLCFRFNEGRMKNKAVIIGALIVLLLGGIGSYWLRPRLERALTAAAQQLLAAPVHNGAYDEVKVSFSGQVATLEGRVASMQEREAAGKLIGESVRVAGIGASFNPVSRVINKLGPSEAFARAHPKPWLLALLANGSLTIAGVLPSEKERANAAQALTTRLAPARPDNKLVSLPGTRPAADLKGTLSNIPDLAAEALKDPDHAVLATSLCDGKWSPVTSAASTDDASILLALRDAQPGLDQINAATASLRQWQMEEARKKLVASLPAPAVTLGLIGDSLHVQGVLGDEDSRRRLLIALSGAYPKAKLVDQLTVSTKVKPEMDFSKALADAPKTAGETVSIFVLKSEGKPVSWDGKGGVEELKKFLTSAGADAAHAQVLGDAMEAEKKSRTAPPASPAPKP